jgi:hypothetical protein
MSSSERDQLTSIYAMYGMMANPRRTTVRKQVISMARNELICKPSPFIELMKNGLPSAHVDIFWSVLTQPAIDHLFSEQLPTPDKVRAVIVLDESVTAPRQEQLDCLYFLQQFVTKLDSDDLSAFLQFVTGSTIMPETIKIMFTSVTGLQRRPIAHTCSNTLELPRYLHVGTGSEAGIQIYTDESRKFHNEHVLSVPLLYGCFEVL